MQWTLQGGAKLEQFEGNVVRHVEGIDIGWLDRYAREGVGQYLIDTAGKGN